jgi:hypothetical protein
MTRGVVQEERLQRSRSVGEELADLTRVVVRDRAEINRLGYDGPVVK